MIATLLTIAGLSLFEAVSSIDNAVINAEVLHTMGRRARKWFLVWGLLFAVVVVRGVLPWLIVWISAPSLGPWRALAAALSGDPVIRATIATAAPALLMAGGTFLVLLFGHWLFLEDKHYGLFHERFFHRQGSWFYALAAVVLVILVKFGMDHGANLALAATIGSAAFFMTHGFKEQAEREEQSLIKQGLSDISKIVYLEIIDATFSIDGVLGAFAFTLSVPLILLGNGFGALIVRQLTVGNIERIKRYVFLKNGAMYSIAILGAIMILDSLGFHIPSAVSPLSTFAIVGWFFWRSHRRLRLTPKT